MKTKPRSNESLSFFCDEFRKRLRRLRESLKLSRPKFADLLDIPPTTLKNYELGYREIGGGVLLLIANHPELSPHFPWLVTGQGEGPCKSEA